MPLAPAVVPFDPGRRSRGRAVFVGFIDETLARYSRLVGTRVYDMLRARGYKGGLRTLRKYLRRVRPKPKAEAFLRLCPLVGEQAQVDWGHVGYLDVAGGKRSLWVFVIVLAYSRAMWAELVLDLSVHSLRRSLVRAALFFGGCPRQWLFDNPKTVVLERHGDVVRLHPELLDLAGARCAGGDPLDHPGVIGSITLLQTRCNVPDNRPSPGRFRSLTRPWQDSCRIEAPREQT